jgi:hypothetical protein
MKTTIYSINLQNNDHFNLYYFQNSQNTVTHADPSERDSLEFEWEAPDYYEGSIVFV